MVHEPAKITVELIYTYMPEKEIKDLVHLVRWQPHISTPKPCLSRLTTGDIPIVFLFVHRCIAAVRKTVRKKESLMNKRGMGRLSYWRFVCPLTNLPHFSHREIKVEAGENLIIGSFQTVSASWVIDKNNADRIMVQVVRDRAPFISSLHFAD